MENFRLSNFIPLFLLVGLLGAGFFFPSAVAEEASTKNLASRTGESTGPGSAPASSVAGQSDGPLGFSRPGREKALQKLTELAPDLAAGLLPPQGSSRVLIHPNGMSSLVVGPEHDNVMYAVRDTNGSPRLNCGGPGNDGQVSEPPEPGGEE